MCCKVFQKWCAANCSGTENKHTYPEMPQSHNEVLFMVCCIFMIFITLKGQFEFLPDNILPTITCNGNHSNRKDYDRLLRNM